MNQDNYTGSPTGKLWEVVGLAKNYCEICENANEYNKEEFTDQILNLLPRIYWYFFDLQPSIINLDEDAYFSTYVEQDLYDDIKNRASSVLGADDVYLETFMEDMKYSETPISASISEGIADLYQPLYDFTQIVHDSEGSQIEEAFIYCKDEFANYWSQILCNLMKAFNNLKFGNVTDI